MPARPSNKRRLATMSSVRKWRKKDMKWLFWLCSSGKKGEISVLGLNIWLCIEAAATAAHRTKRNFVRKKAHVGRLQNIPQPEVCNSKYKALVATWQRTQSVSLLQTPTVYCRLGKQQMFTVIITVNIRIPLYEGWNFNSGNYLFTTDTK